MADHKTLTVVFIVHQSHNTGIKKSLKVLTISGLTPAEGKSLL
jgi:hypothetical protein